MAVLAAITAVLDLARGDGTKFSVPDMPVGERWFRHHEFV